MSDTSAQAIIAAAPQTKSSRQSGDQIIFLEYFRIYAFLAVFISHKFQGWRSIADDPGFTLRHLIATVYNAFMPLLLNGQGGVIIFFFISGYIIAKKIETEPAGIFLIKRIFRIYPLYILALMGQYFINETDIPPWQTLLAQFSLLGDFTGVKEGIGVEWTLRIEVVFYLFAAALCLLSGFKHRYKMMVALITLATILCVLMPPFPSWSPNTFGKFNQFFPFLMVGMSLYYVEIRKCPPIVLVAIVVLALSQMSAGSMPLFMFFAFGMIWWLRDRMPNHRYIPIVSSITYSFYLFHFWLYDFLIQLYKTGMHNIFLYRASAILSLVAVCYAAHYGVEKPFIDLGRLIVKRLGKAKTTVSGLC